MKNKIAKNLLLPLTFGMLVASASANAGLITEDFSGGAYNPANFEIGNNSGSAASGAWMSDGSRGTLRTSADDLNPSSTNILSVTADLTFFGTDIAFLGVRSNGLTGVYNEPTSSLFLRLHNFQNGHTGVAYNSPFNEILRQDPTSGDAFWNDTVRVSLTDDGNLLNVSLQNLVTNELNSFSVASAFSAGGHVTFSGSGNSAWDNIVISHANLAAAGGSVPEPASLALMGLGLAGMGLARRKRNVLAA